MTTDTNPKRVFLGRDRGIVRLLAYEEDCAFTTNRAKEIAVRVGLKES